MSQRVLCADCPECHSEVVVRLGMSRTPEGATGETLYRISCTVCGSSFDARPEDLCLRDKSEEELQSTHPVTTFAWR